MFALLLIFAMQTDSAALFADSLYQFWRTQWVWQGDTSLVEFDSLVGWKSKSNLDTVFSQKWLFSTRVRTDRYGWRYNSRQGLKNVVIIGDSFTFGWGVEDNETFASLVGVRANISCPGWNSWQQLAALKRWCQTHDTTGTVFILMWNQTDQAENEYWKRLPTFDTKEQFYEFEQQFSDMRIDRLTLWERVSFLFKNWYPSILHREDPRKTFKKRYGGIVVTIPTWTELPSGTLTFEDYYRFDGHLRPSGHRKVAEMIERAIR